MLRKDLKMKKFFPAVIMSLVFTGLLVSQMLINGQELSAAKIEKNKERFSVFEHQFSKLKDRTTKGKDVLLKDIKAPIVIVNFWASWCQPCISEFKTLNSLIDKFEDKVFVLGINNDDEDALKNIAKIEKKYGLKFDSLKDIEGKYANQFNITKIPSTIVYHKGKVIKISEKEFNFMSEDFVNLLKSKL